MMLKRLMREDHTSIEMCDQLLDQQTARVGVVMYGKKTDQIMVFFNLRL